VKHRKLLIAGVLAAATSAVVVAQDAPESLLPPGFENAPAQPSTGQRPGAPGPQTTSVPVVQPLPGERGGGSRRERSSSGSAEQQAPRAAPLERIDPALLDQLIELQKPKYDIPPGLSRSLEVVGVLDPSEGGLVQVDSGALNGEYVRAVLAGNSGTLVSRWGSILLRRALASRLATPAGMNGADWAAVRAQLLLRMGEAWPARSLVQEVDSGFYTPALEDAALASYIATADVLGICPIAEITADKRDEAEWQMVRAICDSFEGEGRRALANLERYRRRGLAKNIDVLLAQKLAGSASEGRKAVRIEWNEVEALTPWRYGLALATGMEPPAELTAKSGPGYPPITARAPMLPLTSRAAAADAAAARGILSSAAMVDLYSQIYALGENENEWHGRATRLRNAYVAADPAQRLAAMRELWDEGNAPAASAYGRRVLTAYAAARMPPADGFAESADDLLASMLTAGLDRNAARWAGVVPAGSLGWAMLAVAAPGRGNAVSAGAVEAFHDDDPSADTRRSRFLVAGLAGLRRLDPAAAGALSETVGINLNRQTRWTRAIEAAAARGNQSLVVFLAAAGMQGTSWEQMTALHLFHIVSALRRVGLEAEARMIAAESLARS
jgi:hypothetical protein